MAGKETKCRYQKRLAYDIIEEIKRRQLILIGHVNSMTNDRWPKKVLEWSCEEKRKRGRLRCS